MWELFHRGNPREQIAPFYTLAPKSLDEDERSYLSKATKVMEKLRSLAFQADKIRNVTGKAVEDLDDAESKNAFDTAFKALIKLLNPNTTEEKLQQLYDKQVQQSYQSIYDYIPRPRKVKKKEIIIKRGRRGRLVIFIDFIFYFFYLHLIVHLFVHYSEGLLFL